MIFIFLTFLAAFSIEALGTLVSVIGLSTLFGANPIIIALAIALDLGKLVVVTLLYSYWKKLGILMKSYALIAATVTMIITSAGAAGYLSGEFQKAILGTQEGSIRVQVLKEEQTRLQKRKEQIDAQIATLPEKFTARQRIQMITQFKQEQQKVTDRLTEIDQELPKLQIAQIGYEAKAGPILYISKAFNVPVEVAVKWVILLIIFVFDPLAVFLIVAGNFLLDQRAIKLQEQKELVPTEGTEQTKSEYSVVNSHTPSEIVSEPVAQVKEEPEHVELPIQKMEQEIEQDQLEQSAVERASEPPVVHPVHLPQESNTTTPVSQEEPEVIPVENTAPAERPEIRLSDLRITNTAAGPVYHSSLNDVRADNTVVFESTPSIVAHRYQGIK